jgi:signal transduction histidine kinase
MQNEENQEEGIAASRRGAGRWHLIPLIVILLGMISIVMLILTNQIGENQSRYFALNDAAVEIQLKAATFHLWCEEAITGDESVDMENVWLDIDRAIYLSEVMLKGGEHENGLILQPLKDPKCRTRAEDLKGLLTRLKEIARQRFNSPATAGVGSVLDQSFDAAYEMIERKAKALEDGIEHEQVVNQARLRRLFWGILAVWVVLVSLAAIGLWSRETRRKRAEEALEKAKDQLEIKVTERTKELREVNDRLEIELNERRKAENELTHSQGRLRYLSSRLLTAQEGERRRISGELHDELGGGMATLKLWVNFIRKKLREDQIDLKEECQKTGQYIDQIIEDVHRLSWNLSPSILEDLGLSNALQWLVSNLVKNSDIKITLDIREANFQFPPDIQITIYRIFQEALTNAVKHAQAKNISVVIEKASHEISFSVEDDGKGFDSMNNGDQNGTKRGLGLGTMQDRAEILGGSFNVWSQEGKGTRISLQIPIAT